MQVAIQLLTGAVACGLFIVLARRLNAERELRLYALSLVIAALAYVGFTLRGASLKWLALELAGLILFTLLAWLGVKVSAMILALAWAAHAAWDLLLHKLTRADFVPDWYPLACLAFDLLLAGYIVARFEKMAAARAA